MKAWILCLLLLVASPLLGGEVEIVARLAPKYQANAEVLLRDGTRCDLLSDTYAIEADWSQKWAEAIGQSSHYALLTGKQPGVLLLVKDPGAEWRHLVRCAGVCGRLNIALFVEIVEE